jgi:ion channel
VADFLYFSFATLTTTGYGDLVPGNDLARSFAILEALTGQIYLVTVVAVLVGNLARRGGSRGGLPAHAQARRVRARLHRPATSARNRARRRALVTKAGNGGTGLRPDQGQPTDRALQTKRPGRRRSEWRLIAATHNLLKLHHYRLGPAAA